MIRLYLTPSADEISDDNGVGRVVHAMARHLPAHGVELVSDPARADVTACHIEAQGRQVDVLHCHGLYFEDIPHAPYQAWHREANTRIIATARQARAITVPSSWVAQPFKRDMRVTPEVIPHGVELDEWAPAEPHPYALWNKNRAGDVCDPRPAVELARRSVPTISTFGVDGPQPSTLLVIGTQPHTEMRRFVQHAGVYLATTLETFGIGTLEALAAGVPVIGYRWGATPDLVRDGVDGVLVEPGDYDALAAAYHTVMEKRSAYSARARVRAEQYTWDAAMRRYAALYRRVAEEKVSERHRVCVVVTSYNYGQYLTGAVESVLPQLHEGDEVLIVNDGSTDDTNDQALDLLAVHAAAGVRYLDQPNQGVAAARNNGIAATDCELIVCLDADDQLAPGYLRVCREALMTDRGLGIAYTGLGLLRDDGSVSPSQFPPAFDWEHQAAPGNPPNTCVPTAAMFRRSLWERASGYQQVHAPGEDAEFYTRGLSVGYSARKVADEPWIHYRDHGQGAHRTKPYKAIDGYHPWMRDQLYPMAAPAKAAPPVRSYARPSISVIIPVGQGHGRYLRAALDSLLMQTWRQWEAIVIDDTGGEGLDDVLRPYPFVHLVTLSHQVDARATMGPGAARNAGIAEARAPWLLFLDADDWLTDPTALATFAATAYTHGKYVYSDWLGMKRDGAVEPHTAPEYDAVAWLSQGQHAVTALVPAEWARDVGGFDDRLAGWEDWDFYIKLALKGHCGVRVGKPLLGYRYHTGTERESSLAKRAPLLAELRRRYEGREPMACGSCGQQAAMMERLRADLTAPTLGGAMNVDLQDGQVLMRYTGNALGLQRVNSRHKTAGGRPVKYEYGGDKKLIPVWSEDVGFLESLGTFEQVNATLGAAPTPPPAPAQVVPTQPAETPGAFRQPAAPVLPLDDDEPAAVADVGDLAAAMQQRQAQAEQANQEKAAQAAQTVRGRRARGA